MKASKYVGVMPTKHTFFATVGNGVPGHETLLGFRIVRVGDTYGNGAVHTDPYGKGDMVEVFDLKHQGNKDKPSFETNGQVICQYFVSTLLERDTWKAPGWTWGSGLDLMGDVPSWKVCGSSMQYVRERLYDLGYCRGKTLAELDDVRYGG